MTNVFPEIMLKKIIDYSLSLLKIDYDSYVDKKDSTLYQILNGNKIGNYDYFDQAVKILFQTHDNPRKLETKLFFDRSRSGIPTIHITMPSESHFGDGIGFDTGYVEDFRDSNDNEKQSFTRTFNTKYNIVVTSDNTFEVLIVYYVLKACLMANIYTLELNGLRNAKFGGQDLILKDDIMPTGIFSRSLNFECFYEFTAFGFEKLSLINNINFEEAVNLTEPKEPSEIYFGGGLGENNL
jgi:hypothetical protein